MNATKKKNLESQSYIFTTPADFFGLTDVERKLVKMRHILTRTFSDMRKRKCLSQSDVAKRMNSTQGRVSKIEANHPEVSIDFMIQGLFALGCEPQQLAECVA